jgi:hypothetical protein
MYYSRSPLRLVSNRLKSVTCQTAVTVTTLAELAVKSRNDLWNW